MKVKEEETERETNRDFPGCYREEKGQLLAARLGGDQGRHVQAAKLLGGGVSAERER